MENLKADEPVDPNEEDDYDEEVTTIEEIIYGIVGEQPNVVQSHGDVSNGSFNFNDEKVFVDDETFIDYMNNNGSIRDDWDFRLNETNNVTVDETSKQVIRSILIKCRSLITILKQSSILNGYFTKARSECNVKRTLPHDCVTRWNSTYFLIHSFIDAKRAITKFFGDKHLYDIRRALIERLISIELHHHDWELLSDLQTVLKAFHFATRMMSVSRYPSAGLAYYTIKKIFNYLMRNIPEENTQVKTFKMMLLAQFRFYFCTDEEELHLLQVSIEVQLFSFQ